MKSFVTSFIYILESFPPPRACNTRRSQAVTIHHKQSIFASFLQSRLAFIVDLMMFSFMNNLYSYFLLRVFLLFITFCLFIHPCVQSLYSFCHSALLFCHLYNYKRTYYFFLPTSFYFRHWGIADTRKSIYNRNNINHVRSVSKVYFTQTTDAIARRRMIKCISVCSSKFTSLQLNVAKS